MYYGPIRSLKSLETHTVVETSSKRNPVHVFSSARGAGRNSRRAEEIYFTRRVVFFYMKTNITNTERGDNIMMEYFYEYHIFRHFGTTVKS